MNRTPQERFEFTAMMIEKLDIADDNMTEWEQNFVLSVRRQFMDKGKLSDRQMEILERIYSERTK